MFLRVFSVHALRGVGDAASYSANLARGKSFSDSVFYELDFSNDDTQIIHTHQDLSIRVFSIGYIIVDLRISDGQ